MFGYITVQQPELKIREFDTYRSFYCGLCRALRRACGLKGQATLSYDMTFLALLLTALYEPQSTEGTTVCLPHPGVKHPTVTNEYVEYAADMNILLSYYNLLDDWADDRKVTAGISASLLKRRKTEIAAKYPRQARALEAYVEELHACEEAREESLDTASGLTGRMLGEVFAVREDVWAPYLRRMGFYLGKFIYLMDAFEDLEKDEKKDAYNPWRFRGKTRREVRSQAREVLTMMMSECSLTFEQLPVLQYETILRNILYAGVWVKFEALAEEDEKAGKSPEGTVPAEEPEGAAKADRPEAPLPADEEERKHGI
ncbi:MAG: hypothetical protein ILP12_05050 [Lachnospiraceae bacterium]|nr:hypothetical protein [Lachnospiraceae bacterium]